MDMARVGYVVARLLAPPLRSLGFPIVRVWTFQEGREVQVRVYREGNFLAFVLNSRANGWASVTAREYGAAILVARQFWHEWKAVEKGP